MVITKALAITFEAVGSITIIAGIIIEVTAKAPIGYIIITAGSLGVVMGGIIFAKVIKG